MRHWFTRADLKLQQATVKRFDPSHWTVEFPRESMACVVSQPSRNEMEVTATFARKGDLVGLVFDSEDRHVHVGHRRRLNNDYSGCVLSFRWQSANILSLEAVNGPTLTIEGEDEAGERLTWFVRLWNYASGTAADAHIVLPFDQLDAGFAFPSDAQRVNPRAITRMFISLVAPGFQPGNEERFAVPVTGSVTISNVECEGSGSTIAINDAFVPEHDFRICTAFDDLYHLTPERVIDEIERLGYRKIINHYVGMSHYPALTGVGLVDPATPLCEPARRWHESFAKLAAERDFAIIWSVSMELLDAVCPPGWKQRAWDGQSAQTGYEPPSALLSPAVGDAVAYLGDVAAAFVSIGVAEGLPALVQVGEPWWWVREDGAICLYDAAARQLWPADHQPITDVRSVAGGSAALLLDKAGQILSDATAAILQKVRSQHLGAITHLLAYLPSILRADAPELWRANLPAGWATPAFDVLQLEDYEWVTEQRLEHSRRECANVAARLNYPLDKQHYLAGFVTSEERRSDWSEILSAASRAAQEGAAEIFLWALPQVLRDDLTIFQGEEEVDSFCDVDFPLDIGMAAWVEPHFSTSIMTGASGYEFRNCNWEQARLHFDAGPGVRSTEDLQRLLSFFRSMRGNAVAFRFRDPLDYSSSSMSGVPSANDVQLGVGDGERRRFALLKRYGTGEERRITRPVANTISVAVAGVPTASWSLSDDGVIEFADAPASGAIVTAGFLFDVPVRFAEERLRVTRKTFLAGEAVTVPLIEVREA